MAKYWKLLGSYDSETKEWTAFAVSGLSSPYMPVEDARLKAVRAIANRSSAASLINHVAFRLGSTSFSPNQIECGIQGSGLQTAPALQSGDSARMDWECDQPVKSGVAVSLEGKNITADTPVTVDILLYGLFDNGKG